MFLGHLRNDGITTYIHVVAVVKLAAESAT